MATGYYNYTIPPLLLVLAYGLSMDYEVFVLSPHAGRMAEVGQVERRQRACGRSGTGAHRTFGDGGGGCHGNRLPGDHHGTRCRSCGASASAWR